MVNDRVVPIEVKAGSYKRLQSMEVYSHAYDPEKMIVVSAKWTDPKNLVSVPLPMVWKIKGFV